MTDMVQSAPSQAPVAAQGPATNLADILERVLDRGIVVAGDIQVNLLDIELLTIKLRIVIASLDTARQVGINWWENDPWLTGKPELAEENQQLRERLAELEGAAGQEQHPALAESGDGEAARRQP
jgi:hypothetical protein